MQQLLGSAIRLRSLYSGPKKALLPFLPSIGFSYAESGTPRSRRRENQHFPEMVYAVQMVNSGAKALSPGQFRELVKAELEPKNPEY